MTYKMWFDLWKLAVTCLSFLGLLCLLKVVQTEMTNFCLLLYSRACRGDPLFHPFYKIPHIPLTDMNHCVGCSVQLIICALEAHCLFTKSAPFSLLKEKREPRAAQQNSSKCYLSK